MSSRKRISRSLDYFEKVSLGRHSQQFHDLGWCQEVVKKALRFARDARAYITILEGRDTEHMKEVLSEVLSERGL
jgi:hypothetical protein